MDGTRGSATVWWVLIAVVYLFVFIRLDRNSVFFTDDGALAHAVAEALGEGEIPLAGPPAARGGRHFGPYYFYFEGALLLLSFGSVLGAVALAAVAKGVGLCAITEHAAGFVTADARRTARGLGALLFLSGIWYWCVATPWHSNFMMLLGSATAIAAFRVLREPARALPAFIILANLAVLTHLAALPLVAVLSLCIVIRMICGRRTLAGSYPSRRRLLAAAFTAAVCWIPTLVYERGYEPNLRRFVAERVSDQSGKMGAAQALEVWVKSVGQFIASATVGGGTFELLLASFLVLLLGAGLIIAYRESPAGDRWCIAAAAASCMSYLPAIMGLPPPGELHYLHTVAGPIAFLAIVSLTALTGGTAALLRASGIERVKGAGAAVACAAGLTLMCMSVVRNVEALWLTAPWPAQSTLAAAQRVAGELRGHPLEQISVEVAALRGTGISRDALYSLLGPSFRPKIRGARKLRELPSFERRTPASSPPRSQPEPAAAAVP